MDKFIPYGLHQVTPEDISAVVDVLQSKYLTQGNVVPSFESAVSKKVFSKFSVAVNSATSALHLACLSLGLGPGDRLWTTSTTFVASANCARYCGATVDFVDIDPLTGLISIPLLRKKLDQAERLNKLPKIVVPVHLAGSSCNMSEIYSLSKRYSFSVLEDASHAIGGLYNQSHVGSCKYSDITVFSFHPVKIITTGEGGIATTNDKLLYQRMLDLRSHGIVKDSSRFEHFAEGPWSYEQQCLGFNYRMTDIQAALGLSQLNRLDQVVQERRRIYNSYNALLSEFPVKLLSVPSDVLSAHHLAVIRLKNKSPSFHLEVFNALRSYGIGVQLHYSPVHLQPYYRRLGFNKGDFPESEAYANNAISLPIYPTLSEAELLFIVDKLRTALCL